MEKKSLKKLMLKKETVGVLTQQEKSKIKGGGTTSFFHCTENWPGNTGAYACCANTRESTCETYSLCNNCQY